MLWLFIGCGRITPSVSLNNFAQLILGEYPHVAQHLARVSHPNPSRVDQFVQRVPLRFVSIGVVYYVPAHLADGHTESLIFPHRFIGCGAFAKLPNFGSGRFEYCEYVHKRLASEWIRPGISGPLFRDKLSGRSGMWGLHQFHHISGIS